nr:tyrosine-type recombinase/integrase [Flavonifractor sp. An112]
MYEQTDETHFVSGADILRYWEDASIRANRKNVYGDKVTPHILRHTYITNLLLRGVDIKTVQYLAGHERAKITLDIYAHLTYNRPEEIIEKINMAFAPGAVTGN